MLFGQLPVGAEFYIPGGNRYRKVKDGGEDPSPCAEHIGPDEKYARIDAWFCTSDEVEPVVRPAPLTPTPVHYRRLRPGSKVKSKDGDVLILLPDGVYDEEQDPVHAVSLVNGRVFSLDGEYEEVTPCHD